jgi:hypothetical protein
VGGGDYKEGQVEEDCTIELWRYTAILMKTRYHFEPQIRPSSPNGVAPRALAQEFHRTAPRSPRYGHCFLVKSLSLSLSLSRSLARSLFLSILSFARARSHSRLLLSLSRSTASRKVGLTSGLSDNDVTIQSRRVGAQPRCTLIY